MAGRTDADGGIALPFRSGGRGIPMSFYCPGICWPSGSGPSQVLSQRVEFQNVHGRIISNKSELKSDLGLNSPSHSGPEVHFRILLLPTLLQPAGALTRKVPLMPPHIDPEQIRIFALRCHGKISYIGCLTKHSRPKFCS